MSATMNDSYYKPFFVTEDGDEYGSFEVFRVENDSCNGVEVDTVHYDDGWYWWACFPGCLPDSEPSGPFDSSEEAEADALMQ